MAWYYILFFSVLAIFFVKTIITLVFGDTDIDFDADGDIDFDISSMFSFKGLLHFLLGFSSYLAAIAKFDKSYDYVMNETYHFSFDQFIFAGAVGLLFMWGLFHLYKLMMKLNHYNNENFDVNNYTCTVLIRHGLVDIDKNASDGSGHDHAYAYTVLVNTEVGSRKITVLSEKENLQIGSEHKIYMDEEGIYYIS